MCVRPLWCRCPYDDSRKFFYRDWPLGNPSNKWVPVESKKSSIFFANIGWIHHQKFLKHENHSKWSNFLLHRYFFLIFFNRKNMVYFTQKNYRSCFMAFYDVLNKGWWWSKKLVLPQLWAPRNKIWRHPRKWSGCQNVGNNPKFWFREEKIDYVAQKKDIPK